jgi:hypothetical protein
VLYLGHFVFDAPKSGATVEGVEGGWFTCIVEAESAEGAAEKFWETLDDLKGWHLVFKDVGTVYLDDIIEIKKPPEKAVMTHFAITPSGTTGTSTSLVNDSEGCCDAYDTVVEGRKDETIQPFISFEA